MGGMLGAQAQSTKLTLDDNVDLVPVINAAAEAGGTYDVTFSDRPINLDNWNVWCLPFDIKVTGFKNYLGSYVVDMLIKSNNDGNIHFEPTVSGIIPAGTPFIINVGKLKKTPTNFKKVTFKDVELKQVEPQYVETDASGNAFISTFSPIEVYGQHIWYMSKGKWYDARNFSDEKPVHLKPMRCYIDFSGNTVTTRPMIIIEEPDGTTSIVSPETFNEGSFSTDLSKDNNWYSVTGARLSDKPTTHGIYIHQGRKVVIK
jgi:hypothetical protein